MSEILSHIAVFVLGIGTGLLILNWARDRAIDAQQQALDAQQKALAAQDMALEKLGELGRALDKQ